MRVYLFTPEILYVMNMSIKNDKTLNVIQTRTSGESSIMVKR